MKALNNLLNYNGYYGSVEYSADDRVFFGKIELINDLVTYEATNVDDLEREFKDAVEDYIETCKKVGKEPQKAFKGSFNVRLSSELHKNATIEAMKRKISLNKFIENAVYLALESKSQIDGSENYC